MVAFPLLEATHPGRQAIHIHTAVGLVLALDGCPGRWRVEEAAQPLRIHTLRDGAGDLFQAVGVLLALDQTPGGGTMM